LPERLVDLLVQRLKRHSLWNSLLMFLSPLLAFFYLVILLYTRSLVEFETLIFSLAGGLGIALALIFHYGWMADSKRFAARLIDERIGGEDRFYTLATVNPLLCPVFMLARLRDEARGLLHLVDLRKDFPYRGKRALLISLASSLVAVILIHLLSQSLMVSVPYKLSVNELEDLAQQLSQIPRYSQLARDLIELAVRLPRQGRPTVEGDAAIQELVQKIEDRLAGERQSGEGEGDLLSQVASTLRGLEEGVERQGGQGGGLRTGPLGQREGQGKELSEGGGVGEESELAGFGSIELRGRRLDQGKTEEAEKRQGDGSKGDADRLKGGRKKGRETGGPEKAEMEGESAETKDPEIPRGKTPERFLKPGEEGEKGVKGARFVTVELPEGQEPARPSGSSKGRRRRLRPKVPVSNVPLPPFRGTDAAREEQRVPLEYRGLIR
jgi:hypothetical protein